MRGAKLGGGVSDKAAVVANAAKQLVGSNQEAQGIGATSGEPDVPRVDGQAVDPGVRMQVPGVGARERNPESGWSHDQVSRVSLSLYVVRNGLY
jgi:hypothetical protein